LTAAAVQGPQITLSDGATHDAIDVWFWFDQQAPAFAAYVLFAVALGIAFGALIGRTYPAMALTLVLFFAIRTAVAMFLRPRYLPPLRTQLQDFGLITMSGRHSSFVLYDMYETTAGRALTYQEVFHRIGGSQASATSPVGQNLAAHGIVGWEFYQPGDRFWTFQSIEAAIFIGLAALLIGLTVYWVTRRLC
jgi:hypothetical protein